MAEPPSAAGHSDDSVAACEPPPHGAADDAGRLRSRRAEARAQLAPWQVKVAQDLLVADPGEAPPLAAVAQRLGLSATHFIKAFANTVGIAPYRWLLCQRILKSIELLQDESLSLARVAIDSGFADQSHYTRAFKNILGVTPGRWRRAIRAGLISQREALEGARQQLAAGKSNVAAPR